MSIILEGNVQFAQPGAGAVTRTVDAKLREMAISVDDFGAVGDGITDDHAAIVAAQTALLALSGGELLFTHGKTYLVATPVPMENGVTYKGTGSSGINQHNTVPGAKIVPSGTAGFINAATTRHEIKFENLFFHSLPGGGMSSIGRWRASPRRSRWKVARSSRKMPVST